MIVISEVIIFLIILYEYKIYKILSTPIIILSGVYLIYIPLINIIGPMMGYNTLNDNSILMFTLFLSLMFLISIFYSKIYSLSEGERGSSDFLSEKLISKEQVVWKIYLISLICYIISLIQTINRYGIENTKSNAFGFFAHVGFVSRCLLPIIIFYLSVKKKPKYFIAIIANLIALIMFQGKYHLYISIASSFVLYLTVHRNIKLKTILKTLVIVFALGYLAFVSVYTIVPNIITGDISKANMLNGLAFSSKHFFYYLFSPFIASNEYFATPQYRGLDMGLKVNFNGIYRMFQFFIGDKDYFSPVIMLRPIIDNIGTSTNVGGLFSESVLNIGYLGSALYVLGVTLISYHFMLKMLLENRRIISTLTLLGILSMSFFCNYFSLQPNLECFVYSYILDVLIFDYNYVFNGVIIKL